MTTNSRAELIIIDQSIADWQSIQASIGSNAEVFLLDPTRDGVDQISALLAGRTGIDALHIFSHGASGEIQLGSTWLDAANIGNYAQQWAGIRATLKDTADILLYGCDVAAGDTGQAFITALADATGADVAASTDVTGAAALGGDWNLEVATGGIEAAPLVVSGYPGTLQTVTGTSGNDTLYGSAGNDVLAGGPGNDSYWIGTGEFGLTIFEQQNEGIDAVYVEAADRVYTNSAGSSSFRPIVLADNVENAYLKGASSQALGGGSFIFISIRGNGLDNYLYSEQADAWFYGGAGNDTMVGGVSGGSRDAWANWYADNGNRAGINVNLQLGTADGAGVGHDTLVNIHNVWDTVYNDTIIGGNNQNNRIVAGTGGDDTFMGGSGSSDVLDYFNASGSVNINLLTGLVTGAAGNDSVSGFEIVTGSAFDDRITSSNAGVRVSGAAGNDNLIGGNGNDWLSGDAGNDTLSGGAGTDTAGFTGNKANYSFSGSAANLTIFDLRAGSPDGTDTLLDVESLQFADGTYSTAYTGTLGNDRLIGTSGNDVIDGLAGNDVIDGLAGADSMTGGLGNDIYYVDNTSDRVVENLNEGTDTIISSVGYTLPANVENLMLVGTPTWGYGNSLANTVTVADQSGFIAGSSGSYNVSIYPRGGNDTISGGSTSLVEGMQLYLVQVDYSSNTASQPIQANLGTGVLVDYDGSTDTLINVRALVGGAGNDVLTGGSRIQFLSGEFSERFQGNGGNDTIDGGETTRGYGNSLLFNASPAGVVVNMGATALTLTDGSSVAAGTARDGYGTVDTFQNINTVVGSNLADYLVGSSAHDQLEGGGGNDTIDGAGGQDSVSYNSASSSVIVNLGSVAVTYNGVTVNAATSSDGYGTVDTLRNIESARGSNNSDILIGSDSDNRLRGDGGYDTIDGGAGIDFASYETSPNAITVFLENGNATLGDGYDKRDTLTNIEGIIGTSFNDHFSGGAGDQRFMGRGGSNTINGGAGSDWVSYRDSPDPAAVTVNLASGTATNGWGGLWQLGGTDTLTSIENAEGGDYADSLIGDATANQFIGGGGNDTINGGAGQDVAIYTGSRIQYTLTTASDGSVTVRDLRSAAGTALEGADTLRSIETLRFADGDVALPTYALTATPTSVNEGSAVTFTVATANVAANTVLNYTLSGTGITTADIGGAALTGTTTVASNGTASFTVNLTADQLTEGAETLTATVQGQSASVTVNDTPIQLWTRISDTTAGATVATSLTRSSDGSVYMAGRTDGGSFDGQANLVGQDVFITRYNSDGSKAWSKLLGDTSPWWVSGLTTGTDGAVYLSGSTYSNLDGQTNGGMRDAFITRFSPEGVKVWTRLAGGGNYEDASSLTTGADGAIYMAGYAYGNLNGELNSGLTDAFIIRYNPDGSKAWTKLAGGPNYDGAHALTTGIDGAIYLAGETGIKAAGLPNWIGDAILIRYNSDGSKVWSKTIGGDGHDQATSLTTGSDGSIYMAGFTASSSFEGNTNSGGEDVYITRYNPDGSQAWTKLLGGAGNDRATSLMAGSNGTVYVAGYTDSNGLQGQPSLGGRDAFVAGFKSDGTLVWTKLLGGNGNDQANSLSTGADGTVYVAGSTSSSIFEGQTNPGGVEHAFIVKLSVTDGNGNTPVITSAATASVAENGTGTVYTATGTDADAGTTLTYALGGTDAARFNINTSSGAVTFKAAPNFEAPTDSGANNVYDITVTASDGFYTSAAQAVAITVTNVNFAGRTKYFVLSSSTGANFTDFNLSYGSVSLTGEQVTFVGSSVVDAVFVRPGVTLDFTLSGSGADKIYLGGSFANYTSSIAGSVMTLQRGSGATLESVSFIKSTSAASSDSVIFADGTLNSLDLYNNLKTATALPALATTETSLAPLAPAAPGSVLNASIKAFALNAGGDTFAPTHPGVAMTVVGSVGVDTVYVPRGGVVDCTLLGSSQDLIYFTGNWTDYTKAISGSVLTFSRTVEGYNESVKVVGSATNISLNDHLVFADGAVYSGDAKTALTASLTTAITAVTGYDATMTTPGIGTTLLPNALNGVTDLEVGSNIVLNYSANVSAVVGKYIHIVNDGGTGFHGESTVNTLDIRVTDTTQVSIVGGKVMLNPTADLDLSNNYHITIDAGAFTTTATGAALAAYDGTSTLHFSTVTPGTTALANAVASHIMNADGTLGSGHLWLDIEGIGNPSARLGTALDLSGNNYVLVAKDYDAAGSSASTGYDGVKTADFYVAATSFGAGDLLYIDNQSSTLNDIASTIIINHGAPPTTVQFAGTGLGGIVDISLAGTTTTFDTVAQMKLLLGASTSPVISA